MTNPLFTPSRASLASQIPNWNISWRRKDSDLLDTNGNTKARQEGA